MSGPLHQLAPALHTRPQRYLADDRAPADARRHVRTRLTQSGLSSMVDDIEVVTSELVTNAVLYGGGAEIQLQLLLSAKRVLVKVWDRNPLPPLARRGSDPLPDFESGRGLVIVDALSTGWGWYPEGPGKVVWSEFAVKEAVTGPACEKAAS